jgi:hypothetical protein
VRLSKGTQVFFTHKTFSTEKPLHRTVFTQKKKCTEKFWRRKNCTQTAQRSFYTPTFLHAEILPRTEQFLHSRKCSAQKPLDVFTHNLFFQTGGFYTDFFRTDVLRAEGFTHNNFYTQTLLQSFTHRWLKCLYTKKYTETWWKLCTQHVFTHSQLRHREVLFPFLDHLPFVFPSQVNIPCQNNKHVLASTGKFNSLGRPWYI